MVTPNLTDTAEVWKDIPGYEQCYQVSNHGRVRSKDRYVAINGGLRLWKSKILKSSVNHYGYPQISLYFKGKGSVKSVHQLVAWAFLGPQLKGMEVNHIDTVKTNNHVSNLEYLTQSGNTKHAHENGLMTSRKRTASCKLTDEQVREIRRLFASGMNASIIAKQFNHNANSVMKIGKGLMYTWVE